MSTEDLNTLDLDAHFVDSFQFHELLLDFGGCGPERCHRVVQAVNRATSGQEQLDEELVIAACEETAWAPLQLGCLDAQAKAWRACLSPVCSPTARQLGLLVHVVELSYGDLRP